ERELLEILLHFPQVIDEVAALIQPAQIGSAAYRHVYSLCVELSSRKILPEFNRLLLEIDDPVVKNLLVELDESGRPKAAEWEVRLQDVLTGFERRQQEHWSRENTAALKERRLAEEDELAVLLELERHQRARQQAQQERFQQGTSGPTDGQDAFAG